MKFHKSIRHITSRHTRHENSHRLDFISFDQSVMVEQQQMLRLKYRLEVSIPFTFLCSVSPSDVNVVFGNFADRHALFPLI